MKRASDLSTESLLGDSQSVKRYLIDSSNIPTYLAQQQQLTGVCNSSQAAASMPTDPQGDGVVIPIEKAASEVSKPSPSQPQRSAESSQIQLNNSTLVTTDPIETTHKTEEMDAIIADLVTQMVNDIDSAASVFIDDPAVINFAKQSDQDKTREFYNQQAFGTMARCSQSSQGYMDKFSMSADFALKNIAAKNG